VKTKTFGIVEAARRSGLTREQIVYIEERGFVGAVARVRELRRFTESQIAKLERIAAGRRVGMRLDEANLVASTGYRPSANELRRLQDVARAKAAAIRRDLEAWEYVTAIMISADDDAVSA